MIIEDDKERNDKKLKEIKEKQLKILLYDYKIDNFLNDLDTLIIQKHFLRNT
jgi:hypothetical protein